MAIILAAIAPTLIESRRQDVDRSRAELRQLVLREDGMTALDDIPGTLTIIRSKGKTRYEVAASFVVLFMGRRLLKWDNRWFGPRSRRDIKEAFFEAICCAPIVPRDTE
jgi:hypothetical protein